MKHYPADTDPAELPHPCAEEIKYKIGDLLKFTAASTQSFRTAPFWKNKKVALVKAIRWAVIDWHTPPSISGGSRGEPYLVPEYILLWNDGRETNTSQKCLERAK